VTFNGLVQAMDVFSRYWLEIVELPLASETVEGDRAR
jgi:hypothetical protein